MRPLTLPPSTSFAPPARRTSSDLESLLHHDTLTGLSPRKRILVTNATSDAAIGVIRELVTAGHDVVGADTTILPLGFHSRYLKTVHRLPPPTDTGFDESLVALIRTVGPDVLFPLGRRNVEAACRQASEISRHTAMVVPTPEAFMAAFDHAVCPVECALLGIPCPAVYTQDEAVERLAVGGGNETLVVKPRTDVGSARGVTYVNQPEELRQSVADCTAQFGAAIVQEYIPGPASSKNSVSVLFDQHSELLAAFTVRTLRQWPPTGGLTVLGVSTAEAQWVELVLPFFKKWRWRGFAEVELKVDPRDGIAKVIEINPHNAGYLRFCISCGLPLGRLAVAAALGDATAPSPFPNYVVGKKLVIPELFLRSVAAEWSNGGSKSAALVQALASLSGTGGFLADLLTDPSPRLGRLLLSTGRAMIGRPAAGL